MSLKSDNQVNQKLEESLNLAGHGDEKAAREFFLALLEGPLYVPERYQNYKLTNVPPYPNDFVNVLGVQDRDRAVVPIFSNPALIEGWCGQPLSFRKLTARELFETVPAEWWLIVNPGSETEKEISPWELELLREGVQGIPAIIEELFPTALDTVMEVHAPGEEEYIEARSKLSAMAASREEIEKLFLLVQDGVDMDDLPTTTLLIGAQANISNTDQVEALREEIRSVVDVAMIGRTERVKVLVGSNTEDNLMLGIFKNAPAFYQKAQPSVMSRIFKAFTS